MKPRSKKFSPSDIQISKVKLREAIDLKNRGNIEKSISEFKKILLLFPNYAAAHKYLAEAYIAKQNWLEAAKHLGLVRLLDPTDYNVVLYLEAICNKLNLNEAGKQLARSADELLALNNILRHPTSHYLNMSSLQILNTQLDEAIETLKLAEKQDPKNTQISIMMSECLFEVGNTEQADEILKNIAFGNKDIGKKATMILCLRKSSMTNSELERCIRGLQDEISKSGDEHFILTFALAGALDSVGRFEESWKHISSANAKLKLQLKKMYDSNLQWRKQILASATKSSPVKSRPKSTKSLSDITPIFILGVSRAGKSTLEGLLGEVEDVKKGFENFDLENAVIRTNLWDSRVSSETLTYIPPQLFDKFSDYFHEKLISRANNSKFLTSTKPSLISNVPSIVRSIPNAKFVFIKRDISDNVVSILLKHYWSANTHACDPIWTKEYIEWYLKMIDIWIAKFPNGTHVVEYDKLVAEPHKTLKDILDFTGIGSGKMFEISSRPFDDRGVFERYSDWLPS